MDYVNKTLKKLAEKLCILKKLAFISKTKNRFNSTKE
jgi:hypothetical protein